MMIAFWLIVMPCGVTDMPLTNAEKQKAHRRRMAEKMARYEGALERIADLSGCYEQGEWAVGYEAGIFTAAEIASAALNPTDPAKS